MLTILLTIFHVIVCIFLILVVLIQQGKGADWAGAFGGGGTQTAFGARGTGTLLSKATTAAAIVFVFMITSLALTILISQPGGSSVIHEGAKQNQPQQQQQPAQQNPAQPAPAGQTPAQQQPAPATPSTPEKK